MTELNEFSDIHDAVPAAQPAAIPDAGPRRRAGRKGPRALWFGVAALTVVVTVAAVGLPQLGWLAAQTATTTWSASHAVTAVEVNVSGGDLTIRPTAATGPVSLRQTLTWTATKPRVTEMWQGDTLWINEDCPGPSFTVVNPCGADLELAVPASVTVQSTVDSGSLTIRRMTGSVTARAQSGDIELDDVSGTLWARADSGSITGNRLVSSQVNVQTLSGDVALYFAAAPSSVAASVDSGSVTVLVPRGSAYRVSGETASGDRTIAPGIEDDSSPRGVELNTQSGDTEFGYSGGG